VLSSDIPLSVVDAQGRVVGSIDRPIMITTISGQVSFAACRQSADCHL
jgi:hypothetical protein